MSEEVHPSDLPLSGHIPRPLFPPNFQRLAYHRDWRTSWTHIVPGAFSSAPYSGLLFYEQSNGYAEFYETDGHGGISFLKSHPDWRTSWTHIISGKFSDSPFTGLLLYDQAAGFAAVYDTDGKGNLIKLREYDGWRTSWTNITTVRIPESNYSAIVLYDRAAGRGEILRCTGSGRLLTWKTSDGWRTSWTHVVGDFKSGTCLLFYEASTGFCEIYTLAGDELPKELGEAATRGGMPPATDIVPGNFGSEENTGFLFYDRPSGRAAFVFLAGPGAITVGPEAYSDWRTSWDLIVPGNFWEPDPEYTKFQNGFTDLLFYDRAQGYGEFWLHEPYGAIIESPLEGYVSPGSVAPGETLSFYVNSRVGPYTVRIFRQAADEEFMTQLGGFPASPQPLPIGRLDYRDGPAWPPVAHLVVPHSWPSGLYLARVEAAGGGAASAVLPFVVRAAVPGSQARVLVCVPDTTYEAYNFWGGRSLYGFRSSIDPGIKLPRWSYGSRFNPYDDHQAPRAFRVSFRRPYNEDPGVLPKWRHWEVPLLRWLARQGIAVELCTSTDLHKDGANHAGLLANYRLLVSVGHDEYWSKEMRDAVEAFTVAGGNVAFFSGNVSWFQCRFDLNVTRQVCYKDARFDPLNPAQRPLVTVNWWDKPVCRAETALTGVSFYDPINQFRSYRVRQSGHWVFEGLDFADGDEFGTYDRGDGQGERTVVGGETDKYQPQTPDPCKPASPQNLQRLAEVPGVHQSGDPDESKLTCTMGIFTHGKGQVFTAATLNWSLGLSPDGAIRNAIDRITRNVFDRLG